MTCKDCLHCNVCAINGIDVENTTFKKELCCGEFKDKSRIVELPCKVGETVHYITFWKNEYNYHLITNVTYDILYQLYHEMETGYVVFMTDEKSKAEAKLKELNDNEMSI